MSEHWPSGKPPRIWAREIEAGKACVDDVPPELTAWVLFYLDGQPSSDSSAEAA